MKSDSLFELIQSLTKNEKRALHISAQRQGNASDKDYMALFHFFSTINEYNKEIVLFCFVHAWAQALLPARTRPLTCSDSTRV